MDIPGSEEVDVIVVGAGPVGLAAALLLERAELSGVVFEASETRSQRSMVRDAPQDVRLRASELAALWGFGDALEGQVDTDADADADPDSGGLANWTSAHPYRVALDRLEYAMEQQVVAECHAVDLLTGMTVVAVEQDADGVTATVVDAAGERSTVRAAQLVAADGAASTVRSMLGLALGRDDLTADHYRVGRVFLAGDAAHSLPNGGFGLSTGFEDIHNLVWKLRWVARDIGPASLLDSYESERRPIAVSNAAWLAAGAEHSSAAESLAQDIGYCYVPLEPGATPTYERLTVGGRAPHAPLATPHGDVSTIEAFDGELSLVVGPISRWREAAAAQVWGERLQVLVVGDPAFRGADGRLLERFDLGPAGGAVIRPDGQVAWMTRSDDAATPESAAAIGRKLVATGLVLE